MPTDPPRLDRRKRKSQAALKQALLQLITAKPYDAITIENIAETADVARATFYAHYDDKAALLRETCGELIAELSKRAAGVAPSNAPTYSGAAATEIFRHVDEHRDLYRLVLSGEGGATVRSEMIAALESALATVLATLGDQLDLTPRVPTPLITATLIGGLLLTIEMWLAHELEGQPADLAKFYARTQVNGIEWALGLDHGELLYQPNPDKNEN